VNAPTEFNKALDDILLRHGAEQGELHHSLKEAIKQAVDKYVLDVDLSETPHDNGCSVHIVASAPCDCDWSKKQLAVQRQALGVDKK